MTIYFRKDIEFTVPVDGASSDTHMNVERLIFYVLL